MKRRHLAGAFTGDGARLHGGRWNSPGRAVVYCADSRALAMLEVLAGLQSTRPMGAWVLVEVRFPSAVMETLDPSDLPRGWDACPPSHASQEVGDRWLEDGRSAVLRVPSVIVPDEGILMLNPCHAEFEAIQVGEPQPVGWDERLG